MTWMHDPMTDSGLLSAELPKMIYLPHAYMRQSFSVIVQPIPTNFDET